MSVSSTAESLVDRFEHMVRRDGGSLKLLGVDGDTIRIAYRSGADPTCPDGSCVLPGAELQTLMTETLRREAPGLAVVVEVVR